MPRKPPKTYAEIAFFNLRAQDVGTVKAFNTASKAMLTAVSLAYVAAQQDGWPTQEQYARFWNVTDRTAQREWALFRQAFPTEPGPDRVAKMIFESNGRRLAQLVEAGRRLDRLTGDVLQERAPQELLVAA